MTQERITHFLTIFYEGYLKNCFQEVQTHSLPKEITGKISQYNIEGYLVANLDIYIQNCDFQKEYETIYQTTLFQAKREDNPEVFNQLEIFLIENFQLFVYTMLEAAFKQYIGVDFSKEGIKLKFLPIDNQKIKWVDLVNEAENRMMAEGFNPPSRG